jgi:hypothetical protein
MSASLIKEELIAAYAELDQLERDLAEVESKRSLLRRADESINEEKELDPLLKARLP